MKKRRNHLAMLLFLCTHTLLGQRVYTHQWGSGWIAVKYLETSDSSGYLVGLNHNEFMVHSIQIDEFQNGGIIQSYMDPSKHRVPQGNKKVTTWMMEFDDEGKIIKKWDLGKYLRCNALTERY